MIIIPFCNIEVTGNQCVLRCWAELFEKSLRKLNLTNRVRLKCSWPTEEGYTWGVKRLGTVEHFDFLCPFTAEDVLAAVSWMRLKSYQSLACEKTDNFLMDSASLLDWVEELGWRTTELPSQLPIQADEAGKAVSWMRVAALFLL
jgi:hypothetical protein